MIRASSLGDLMSYPEKDKLPEGAITKLDKMISQKTINWPNQEDSFLSLEKGKACEHESIELYNELNDTFYLKNVERVTVGYLTGECDIIDHDSGLVIDIKTSYSKATHPVMLRLSKLYEWQLRAYMYLYNVDNAELAYCLVNTPMDLIDKRDKHEWHIVDDVPMHLRLRTLRIERDATKEEQMLSRIEKCMEYIQTNVERLKNA